MTYIVVTDTLIENLDNLDIDEFKYEKIKLIDGMLPVELAAVYGLAPKTERFKTRKEQ